MPGSFYNATNVRVGEAILHLQPYVAATPPTMPADSVPLFTAYSAPWVSAGATEDGFRLAMGKTTQDHTIEEQSTPAMIAVTARSARIQATLSEDSLNSMIWTYGTGTIATTAPGASTMGKSVLTLDAGLYVVSAILETQNKYGLPRRILIPRMVASGDVETAFRRAAAKRTYPLNLIAICPVSEIQIVEYTAPATT